MREQETRKEGEPTAGVTELVIAAGSGARSCQTRSEVPYQERLRIVSLGDGGGIRPPAPISWWSIPLALLQVLENGAVSAPLEKTQGRKEGQ